jgi:hypothetical protein
MKVVVEFRFPRIYRYPKRNHIYTNTSLELVRRSVVMDRTAVVSNGVQYRRG